MLYNDDEEDDLKFLLAHIDAFVHGLGLNRIVVDEEELRQVVTNYRQDFPAVGGILKASPFKKAANFFCFFVAEKPVKSAFPESVVGPTISVLPNHQNVMVAYDLSKRLLHGATLTTKNGSRRLDVEMMMSMHSYVDFIQATHDLKPSTHFHLMSLFFEQLNYRFNPGACYDLTV